MAVWCLLGHDQAYHFFFRIGPVSSAKKTTPGKGASASWLARGRFFTGDLKSKTEIVHSIEQEIQLAAGHQFHCAGRKDLYSVISAPVQHHLKELCIIIGRGCQTRTA